MPGEIRSVEAVVESPIGCVRLRWLPFVAEDPCRIHGSGAAHRASAPTERSRDIQRLGGDRLLPDRSPPSCERGRLLRSGMLALPDPLGAMIPMRVKNLLPGGKNLGVTHITNGAFRVHPVEWNVGEIDPGVARMARSA